MVKVKYYHQVFTLVLNKDNDNGFLTLIWQYLYRQKQALLHRKGSNSNYSRIFQPKIKTYVKKSLKIPKGKSEAIHRRIDNTMAKR